MFLLCSIETNARCWTSWIRNLNGDSFWRRPSLGPKHCPPCDLVVNFLYMGSFDGIADRVRNVVLCVRLFCTNRCSMLSLSSRRKPPAFAYRRKMRMQVPCNCISLGCHPRESGGPGASDVAAALDSRFRGNDS